MQADTDSPTALVIDFKAAKRAMKRKQLGTAATRLAAIANGRALTFDQRRRRDEVRLAAKARI